MDLATIIYVTQSLALYSWSVKLGSLVVVYVIYRAVCRKFGKQYDRLLESLASHSSTQGEHAKTLNVLSYKVENHEGRIVIIEKEIKILNPVTELKPKGEEVV